MFALAQLFKVFLVHFVEFGGYLEWFLKLQNSILKHLNVYFVLSSFLFMLLDFHFPYQTVFSGSWSQMGPFLFTFTHVQFIYFVSINFDDLI